MSMTKAKKDLKKSAAKEALGSPALSAKTVLFPKPVASKKPVVRVASKLVRVRKARKALLASLDQAEQVESADKPVAVEPVVQAPVVKPVSAAKPEKAVHVVKPVGKEVKAPHKGILNAACFWAGSVLSDSNAFLRLKKAK